MAADEQKARNPKNMKLEIRSSLTAGGGAQEKYFGTFPQHKLAIGLDKDSENATLFGTNATLQADGTPMTDAGLSASTVSWFEISASGTTNYFKGDSQLISGLKLTGTPGSNDIVINITQING